MYGSLSSPFAAKPTQRGFSSVSLIIGMPLHGHTSHGDWTSGLMYRALIAILFSGTATLISPTFPVPAIFHSPAGPSRLHVAAESLFSARYPSPAPGSQPCAPIPVRETVAMVGPKRRPRGRSSGGARAGRDPAPRQPLRNTLKLPGAAVVRMITSDSPCACSAIPHATQTKVPIHMSLSSSVASHEAHSTSWTNAPAHSPSPTQPGTPAIAVCD